MLKINNICCLTSNPLTPSSISVSSTSVAPHSIANSVTASILSAAFCGEMEIIPLCSKNSLAMEPGFDFETLNLAQ